MGIKKNWDEIKKEIEKRKAISTNNPFPTYRAICVEEHEDLRSILATRLKEIGNSYRDFKIDFSILKYNSEIQSEIIKNGEIDLVIVDLDQYPNDPVNITSQIRAFGWHIPIIFASVEKIKAVKALNLVSVTDLAFSTKGSTNNSSYLLAMKRIDEHLFSLSKQHQIKSLNQILFPILNNLIYHAMDKQVLYLSKGPKIISSAILRAKEIRKHVVSILNEKDKNDTDEKSK
ncbi:MAG: hypothetical protein QW783_03495 [Candidatus Micrarchaeia archaeon]